MIYTVDNLLDKLALVGDRKIWHEVPDVKVKGTVSNVKLYDRTSYFDLEDSGKKINACCDKNDTPRQGEAIEFQGIVMLKTNNFGSNLRVLIKGSPIGTWERHKAGTVLTTQELVKYNNQPLTAMANKLHHGHAFVLIGSDTAINDVIASVKKEAQINFGKNRIAVSKKNDVISAIKKLRKGIDPIACFAVVRGGDDDSMAVWDDPDVVKTLLDVDIPFYTALGHTHSVTLADKYAAQSFPTPGNLGNSIDTAISDFKYAHSQTHQINELTKEAKERESEINKLKENKSSSSSNFWRNTAITLFVILFIYIAMTY